MGVLVMYGKRVVVKNVPMGHSPLASISYSTYSGGHVGCGKGEAEPKKRLLKSPNGKHAQTHFEHSDHALCMSINEHVRFFACV